MVDPDKSPTLRAFLRQLAAILVVNGDTDLMVPRQTSHDMARRLPGAELVIYPDAGHGGIFQHQAAFVPKALAILAA